MRQQSRQVIFATSLTVAIFGLYELGKTILFPDMESITSHIISTIVVGVIAFVTARFVTRRQVILLEQQAESNARLRSALSEAERSGKLLSSILASIAEGLIITDRDSQILMINGTARTLFGLGQKEIVRLAEMSRDPQVNRVFAMVLASGQRKDARIEIPVGDAEARDRRVVQLHAAPLRLGENQIDGVVGAFIDVTKLELLERVRQEFLANVSHELRTPLASITAYVETLLDGALDDPANSLRFLNTIQRNALRMRNLVDDVAELASIEAGAVQLSLEKLRLRDVVAEVFDGLAHRGARNGIQLRNQVDSSLFVSADPRRLDQILTNLVDNAIKFNTPGGEVTVMATATEDGRFATIRVRDTGPGIPPEHVARIFERFYRVDKARSRSAGGTGLGLAIVKHLVRAHGGEATVTSEIGVGSEFTIRLPARDESPSGQERVMATSTT